MADTSYPASSPLALSTSTGLTQGYAASQGSSLATGDLRRRYYFSERFGELAIDQTPFFRLVSSLAKKPTDDPQFKFTEKRHSLETYYFTTCNIQNIQGQSNVAIKVGDAGTAPEWIMKNQIIKVPVSSTSGGGAVTDYALVRVTAVGAQAARC